MAGSSPGRDAVSGQAMIIERQEDVTRAVLKDGWLRTGDLASIDGDGFVLIVGSKKNLVISGGQNIQPEVAIA